PQPGNPRPLVQEGREPPRPPTTRQRPNRPQARSPRPTSHHPIGIGPKHQLQTQANKVDKAISSIRAHAEVAERKAEQTIAGNRGGLSDTLALYAYLDGHPEGLLLFGPLTIMLLALDLAALLYKLGGKDSLYERRQALRIRLAWQADVAATGPLNRRLASALDATVEAYGAARRGLKDWIAAAVSDPVVMERFKLIAQESLLSQLDRRRHNHGAPRGKERREVSATEAVREERPPLQQFPQRQGDGEEFELIELVPGAIVAGERRWRLVDRLPAGHQGGHSVVFEAVEQDGNTRVVIKFAYLPRAQGTEIKDLVRERARRELRNVGRLPSSPFIVPILDKVIEPSQGAIWLATPFAEDGSLASFYKSRPRRSVREVVTVAGQVAAALNVAYTELKMVHRDVKPGNVLVVRIEQREGNGPAFVVPRVQVTDWGLSRIESMMESELDVTPGGTLWFAAPQAHRSGTADPRDDLFGLGCLIWWLVVGEPPLRAELGPEAGPAEIAARVGHRQDSPQPWDRLDFWQPNTPPELAAFVRRLMAFDRDRRAPKRGVNPLHWAETQLKGLLDLLNKEALRTGSELYVGPSCEPEGVRSAVGRDYGDGHSDTSGWSAAGSTVGDESSAAGSTVWDASDDTASDGRLFDQEGATDTLGDLEEPPGDSPAAAS
ncbi:MAG TPA: serine/threonine-protein kinase, partial [Solirubrobacteraceae bacterium]|nr:serine/threonine-protein kinase [Solirubrobacteraceae bacterium]